jgi:hypothetical protein
MRLAGCAREREVIKLLDRGQWPEGCSDHVRAHVAGCRSCRELVLLKQALGQERMKAASEARLEAPGVLWWRAQLRRRNAAMQRIARPFLGAQLFALAVCMASAIVYILALSRRGFDWTAWLGDLPRALHFRALMPPGLVNSPWEIWVAVSVAAVVALMGGLIGHAAGLGEPRCGISDRRSGRRM